MSILKVNQIKSRLLSLFAPHLDISDLSTKDPEREQKILTRCLSAATIYLQTGCSETEAAASVWDGSDDNGIDAAFFDTSDKRVVLVQSKWINKGAGEPEAKETAVFVKGVRDLIEQDSTDFHSRLHAKFNDLTLRLSSPGTSVHLVLSTTGSSQLAKHSTSILDHFLDELNGEEPDPIASYESKGLSEVYRGLSNDPLQSNVSIEATILDWAHISSPYSAYFGLIDGLQLKSWWKVHGKGLLASNIRHSLGSTEVNLEIKQTAMTQPEKFWYFNNGITLVADEALKAPASAASHSAGVFSFRGSSIVNGAQTVSSIAKVDDDTKLSTCRVPIRIIILKGTPEGFGGEVTRTNNLQNRVEARDFVAQDEEQKRLRLEMAIEGVEYQFVRSDEAVASPNSCELVEVTTALACAAGDSMLAVQIKTGIGRFFQDLSKAPYKTLFNPTTSGAKAFNATVVLRVIDMWIDAKKRSLAKKKGPDWGCLVHGNRLLASGVFKLYGASMLSTPIQAFETSLDRSAIVGYCESVFTKMSKEVEVNFSGKFLAVLFKNPSACKQVLDVATN